MKSLVLAAVFTGLTITSASAHNVFDNPFAPAGQLATAALRVMHGCDGQSTTEITINLPDGVMRVTPRMIPGWSVSVANRPLAKPIMLHGAEVKVAPASITWKGGSLPDYAYEAFEFRMMTPNTPGVTLVFPTIQKCEGGGEWRWVEVAPPNTRIESLKTPAPTITLQESSTHSGH